MYAIGPAARKKTHKAGKIALGIKETGLSEDILASYQNLKYIIFHYWKNESASVVKLLGNAKLVSQEEVPDEYLKRQGTDAKAYLLLSYDPEECKSLTGYDILKIQRMKERRYLPFISSLDDIKKQSKQ